MWNTCLEEFDLCMLYMIEKYKCNSVLHNILSEDVFGQIRDFVLTNVFYQQVYDD